MKESVRRLEREIKDLYEHLREAYRCEVELEANNLWEKQLETGGNLRELLVRISYDSKSHRFFLENLFTHLRGFRYEKITEPPFEFVGDMPKKPVDRIVEDLRKNEARAMETYLNALHGPSEDTIEKFWIGEDHTEFFRRIGWLVDQERMHDQLLKEYLDG